MHEIYSSPEVTGAIERAMADVETPIYAWGPVLEVYLPVAGQAEPIEHGLDGIPVGWVTVFQIGGVPLAARVTDWTHQVAWLTGSAHHTRARISFIMLRSEVRGG